MTPSLSCWSSILYQELAFSRTRLDTSAYYKYIHSEALWKPTVTLTQWCSYTSLLQYYKNAVKCAYKLILVKNWDVSNVFGKLRINAKFVHSLFHCKQKNKNKKTGIAPLKSQHQTPFSQCYSEYLLICNSSQFIDPLYLYVLNFKWRVLHLHFFP